ncbi:hypothetical protein [Methylomagnum ishizawai]|nr:hypothetical protein [Methylomagnum ishizawai]
MRYSTIRRDSALLDGYGQQRQAVAAVDAAFAELKASGVLMLVKKNEIRSARGRIEDVVYTLSASMEFVGEMKTANKRHKNAIDVSQQAVDKPVDKSATDPDFR